MKKEKNALITKETKSKEYIEKSTEGDFASSLSDALKQKDEKGFFFALVVLIAVFSLLLIGALADILTLCFEIHSSISSLEVLPLPSHV